MLFHQGLGSENNGSEKGPDQETMSNIFGKADGKTGCGAGKFERPITGDVLIKKTHTGLRNLLYSSVGPKFAFGFRAC